MINLIRGEVYRYLHKHLYWITLVAALISGIIFGVSVVGVNLGTSLKLGTFDSVFIMPAAVILCIFISQTIGREYSDGVIRNKLIQGKTRLQIYGAKLSVSIGVSLVQSVLFLIGFSFIAVKQVLPYLGGIIMLRAGLAFLLMNAVWATLFTVTSMNISRKEIGSILNIVLIIVIMFGSYQLEYVLALPEFIVDSSLPEPVQMAPEEVALVTDGTFKGSYTLDVDDNGVVTYYKIVKSPDGRIPNPHYVRGGLRTGIEQIDNILPHGQLNQYMSYLHRYLHGDDPTMIEVNAIPWFPLYSLGFMAVLTACGAVAFHKKEFK